MRPCWSGLAITCGICTKRAFRWTSKPEARTKGSESDTNFAELRYGRKRTRQAIDQEDLVDAYMWFLIASEQITQAKNQVNQSMTMEQLLEAELRAAEWMRKARKIPLRPSKILPIACPQGRRAYRPPDVEGSDWCREGFEIHHSVSGAQMWRTRRFPQDSSFHLVATLFSICLKVHSNRFFSSDAYRRCAEPN